MARILMVACCLLALGAGSRAHAHATSTSYLSMETREHGPVVLRWDLSVHDLIWSVFIDADYDGLATWQEIVEARPAITRAVSSQLELRRGGQICAIDITDLALATRGEENLLSVALRANCPEPGRMSVGGALFMTGDASQRVLLSVHRLDAHGPGAHHAQLSGVLSPAVREWHEPARPSAWSSFARFVVEGVFHVLIGYDHIAFILLLLLPSVLRPVSGRWHGAERVSEVWRDLLLVVTAFTIAHSATLALAVTGVVSLPAQPVEVAIAASIAVAAAINLLPRLARLRLALAFGFGLVHGFGFASVLGELDTGGSALLPLLAGFNVGVEVAQLGIVALVLPFIFIARRRSWYAHGVLPLGSCALGAAGLVWMVQRLS